MFIGEDEVDIEDDYRTAYESRETARENVETNTNEETSDENETLNRGMKMEQNQSLQIVLARPNDFSEVKSIGDDLNAQKTVLLNLENVKSEDAKRILDFLSGVAYANGANIKMMAQKTFAIMPSNVTFSGIDLMTELENNGYNF